MAPPPNLEAFGAPSREVCAVRRERTNTPLQALITLNDPQFVEAARALATRALLATQQSSSSRGINANGDNAALAYIADVVLCRPLAMNEQAILLSNKDQLLAHYQAHASDAEQLLKVGESPVDTTIDAAQLAAWTMVCNQILNLDEVLNK